MALEEGGAGTPMGCGSAEAARMLAVFEVAAAGHAEAVGAESDSLVYWIAAESAEVVKEAIADTGAAFGGEVLGWSLDDADFTLPGQGMELASELRLRASEQRNRYRAVR